MRYNYELLAEQVMTSTMRPICRVFSVGALWLAFVASAAAQDVPPTLLPPVTVRAPPPGAPSHTTPGEGSGTSPGAAAPNACAGAESGSPQALNCLNLKLKQQVDQINPGLTAPTAPFDARSPDIKIGIVNVPAVQQQYGQNFGVSAIPYRPPPLIYTSPILHP